MSDFAAVLQSVCQRLNDRGVSASLEYPRIRCLDPNDASRIFHFGVDVHLTYDVGTTHGEFSAPGAWCQPPEVIANAILAVVGKRPV